MKQGPVRRIDKRKQGSALLVTALILVLVSMLSIASLDDTSQESTSAARSRSTTRTLHTADAGVQLALGRITQNPPNLSAFDVDLADGANLQSRTRSDASPQPLAQAGLGEAAEGFSLNVGSGAGYVNRVYRVNVTAVAGSSMAEVEAKVSRAEVDAISY